MNDRQRRENERNIRAKNFLSENRNDFKDNTVAISKINNLEQSVAKSYTLVHSPVTNEINNKQHFDDADAFDDLIDELRSISDFARAMSDEIAGLDDKFNLPSSKSMHRKFVAIARAAAADSEALKEVFLDYGMDADFIEILKEKTHLFETALAEAEAAASDQIGLTDTLEAAIIEANHLIDALDPVVRRTYRHNATKLISWIYASKIARPATKKNAKV